MWVRRDLPVLVHWSLDCVVRQQGRSKGHTSEESNDMSLQRASVLKELMGWAGQGGGWVEGAGLLDLE